MNCDYCGAPLKLEDANCPHCGRVNVQAQLHARDMQHYKKEFENTQTTVTNTMRNYKGLTARLIILVLACACLFGAIAVNQNMYYHMSVSKYKEAVKNKAEIIAKIDADIEHKDYASAFVMMDKNNIFRSHEDKDFDKYYGIYRAAQEYELVYNYVTGIYEATDWTHVSGRRYLSEAVGKLYKILNAPDTDYVFNYGDPEYTKEVLEDIATQTEGLMIAYMGLEEEEVREFRNMSSARITAVIEDRLEQIELEMEEAKDEQ